MLEVAARWGYGAQRSVARRLPLLVLIAAAALSPLAACGDDDGPGVDGGVDAPPPPPDAPPGPDADADPGGPLLEVGTGGTSFEAVAEGGPVELVHGPQGGYHILLAARFRGLEPDGLVLSYQVFRGDGTTPLNERFSVRLRRSTVTPSGDFFNRTGDLGVLGVAGPADVANMEAEVHADAVAADGTMVADTLRLLIVDEID